jgi:hypothetical protein
MKKSNRKRFRTKSQMETLIMTGRSYLFYNEASTNFTTRHRLILRRMINTMKIFSALVLLLSATGAKAQISSGNAVTLITGTTCSEIIRTHEFSGTCCPITDLDSGGCRLEVIGGFCDPSGPTWSLKATSTSSEPCPEGDYDVLSGGASSKANLAVTTILGLIAYAIVV